MSAVVRLGVRTQFLRPSEIVTPSLVVQSSVIIFLGIALYLILKWRHHHLELLR